MTLKIATWNVNSLRVRLPHVLKWLEMVQPDVLALQEIKLEPPFFPLEEVKAAGYHAVYSGQKSYNGMAILSREPLEDIIYDIPELNDPARRILAASLGSIRIINLYVPNGENLTSSKYTYKLEWLKKVHLHLEDALKHHSDLVVLGDFNIAPEGQDVHDHLAFEGQLLCSELERLALKGFFNLGLSDCFRLHFQEEKSFSWWDYRLNAFKRNVGLRIDHILVNEGLKNRCLACFIDKDPRGWERPSDHAPVVGVFST